MCENSEKHFKWNVSEKSEQQHQHQSPSFVIFQGPRPGPKRDRRARPKPSLRMYGRWSVWSQCSKSCTTQRLRRCLKPWLCGSESEKEVAYCYLEGSVCHKWIQRQIEKQHTEDDLGGEHNYRNRSNGVDRISKSSRHDLMPGNSRSMIHCGHIPGNIRHGRSRVRIIGGRPSKKGSWPWQVILLNRFKEGFCGGTLIATRWVLTAAHCVRKRMYVRIGEHDLSKNEGTEIDFKVELAVTHPDYNEDTVDADLALLLLSEDNLPASDAPTKSIYSPFAQACLPRLRQLLPYRRLCYIIGWGKKRSSDNVGTDILHEVQASVTMFQVPIVTHEVCHGVYKDYHLTDNMFCAGYSQGRMDSCAGDSGGPLLCKDDQHHWTVFGITSFGEGCGRRGKYGIYAKVSNFIKWIHKTINSNG
ncbi:unnamed protein product [Timema podura]|uniref:Peptidase S1 domain-containing protein n=1 Tax=Timema podura TaxID=61482 RepID=A0ABN7NRB0_TIMPD|nr:unnamed protein product [Timema podura]